MPATPVLPSKTPEPRDPLVKRYRPGEAPGAAAAPDVKEVGGRKDGSEPTRFGDWEKHGRCIDF